MRTFATAFALLLTITGAHAASRCRLSGCSEAELRELVGAGHCPDVSVACPEPTACPVVICPSAPNVDVAFRVQTCGTCKTTRTGRQVCRNCRVVVEAADRVEP